MKVVVTKSYEQPYENPLAVVAGAQLTPNFEELTKKEGWVWCTARDGRSGWTPRSWLTQSDGKWYANREFNAIELTVDPGEILKVDYEESGFVWVEKQDGKVGWVPCEHVSVLKE